MSDLRENPYSHRVYSEETEGGFMWAPSVWMTVLEREGQMDDKSNCVLKGGYVSCQPIITTWKWNDFLYLGSV